MLHIRGVFDRVPLTAQGGEECIKSKALRDGSVDVLPHKAADRAFPDLFRAPLRIVLSVSVRLNDRQAALFAHFVGCAAQVLKVALEIIAVLCSVHKRNGIENDVTMQVFTVKVG